MNFLVSCGFLVVAAFAASHYYDEASLGVFCIGMTVAAFICTVVDNVFPKD